MSKISLTPNASGTGNFTIASPNSNTDRTLTLPDNTGTILTSASNTNFPAGSVLQVVQVSYSTFTSSSSSTYADTGLSATITPSSSSNKILVFSTILGTGKNTGNTKIGLQLLRGATAISVFSTETGRSADYGASAQVDVGTISAINLDSPSTTSATTYKIQLASVSNVAQVFINNVNTSPFLGSTLTLVEVKA